MSEDVVTIHVDGAARGNPGPAAFAYVITGAGRDPVEHAERLGTATNNVAEYTALVQALERAAVAEAARLEGARMTASAMQDRIANKLSLTVGYTEFLITDPRMPADLRDQAQRAMNGARAAAEQMSELKRLTRQEYEMTAPPVARARQIEKLLTR